HSDYKMSCYSIPSDRGHDQFCAKTRSCGGRCSKKAFISIPCVRIRLRWRDDSAKPDEGRVSLTDVPFGLETVKSLRLLWARSGHSLQMRKIIAYPIPID